MKLTKEQITHLLLKVRALKFRRTRSLMLSEAEVQYLTKVLCGKAGEPFKDIWPGENSKPDSFCTPCKRVANEQQ